MTMKPASNTHQTTPLSSASSNGESLELNKETDSVSRASRLVKLAIDEGVELFHDDLGENYARVPVEDHSEVWRLQSNSFKDWIAKLLWDHKKDVPSTETLNSILAVLRAKAKFEGEKHSLFNRVATLGKEIWYDLTDQEWRAVRIAEDGWEIVSKPPILFKRYSHQAPQVNLQRGGNLHDLLGFINLQDSSQYLLMLVYTVSCFIPEIPHPIAILYGPQGSGKTTLFCLLRSLIDPSITPTLSFSNKRADIVQQLSHNWAPFYDNLDSISGPNSDLLCRAVTGEGYTKRKNYSDDDDVIYSYRRCIGLNGVDVIVQRPDLLDRSILFGLERISPSERQEERKLLKRFEDKRPLLLGAIFDTLSKAIRIHPTINLSELPRMADFATWGCAIAVALGYSQEDFLTAYSLNYQMSNEEALQANPLGSVILEFMEKQDFWEGSATELFSALDSIVSSLEINTKSPLWPKAPHALTVRLNQVATNLRAMGISVETGGRSARKRIILLQKTQVENLCSADCSKNEGDDVKLKPHSETEVVDGELEQRITEKSSFESHSLPMTAMSQMTLFPDNQSVKHNDTC